MLKNYPNTHYPRFSFMPKTGISLPKAGVLYLLYPGKVQASVRFALVLV